MNLDLKYFEIPLKIIKRVRYFDYANETSRCRIKTDFIKNILVYLNIFFNSFGLALHKIELKEHTSNETASIEKIHQMLSIKRDHNNSDDIKLPLVIQEAKDRSNMSEKNYIRFRNACSKIKDFKMPALFRLNELKFKLNNFFSINKNEFGYFVEPEEKIKWLLEKIYYKKNKIIKDNVFRLHLSGDGMAASKTRVNLINLTVRILNDGSQKTSSHHTLGNIKIIFVLIYHI